MAGMSFGHPGAHLTANNRYAQLLGAQPSSNNGTWAGGLADALRMGMMGYLTGKDQKDATAADQAFTQGMQAKPWTNPDTGNQTIAKDMGNMQGPPQMVPTAQAGGMGGALQAMQGMPDNPYAGRYARELMMTKMSQDQAAQQAAAERAAQLQNAITLKQTPGAPEPLKPTSDIQNYEYARQNGFPGSFEEWKKLSGAQGGQETFGNNPIWATDAQGNPVLLQPSNRGGVRPIDLPPGVTPQRGQTSRVDLGDKFGVLDATGALIGYIPKGIGPERKVDGDRVLTMPAVPGGPPTMAGPQQAPMPQGAPAPMGAVPQPAPPGGIGVTELPQSPKDREAKAGDMTKAQLALSGLEQQVGLVTSMIDEALGYARTDTPFFGIDTSTGMTGKVLGNFANTDARALNNVLTSIKANIGFDKLQQMREASPTGGALGAVSERENDLLQAVNGALDPMQKDQLVRNLTRIKNLYPQVLAERQAAFRQDYGGVPMQQAAPTAPPPVSDDELLSKYGVLP